MVFLKPPFRAEDMEGLYNRVVKGVYQRLPGHYSVDLNEFIGLMLKVNPKARYSASELLSLPMIIDKINSNGANLKESIEEGKQGLLQTIKFPNNLQYLTDKLPRPNYEPLRVANLSNFEGFRKVFSSDGMSKAEGSIIRNRSAASKANNRSVVHENSVVGGSQLPSIGHKKRLPTNPGAGSLLEDDLFKEQLNRQHNKVEQEIKKYDEILKRNKNMRQQYEINRKKAHKVLQNNQNAHNQSGHHNDSQISASGKNLAGIGIYGVKLENRQLDVRRGGRPHNESSIVEPRGNNKYKLPSLVKLPSQPKGLVAKHLKLR